MKRTLLTLALATVGTAGIANALVAFSTFLPGDVYETTSGYTVGGPTSGNPQRVAMQFTSAHSGIVTTIRFGTFFSSGNTALNLALRHDSGDTLGSSMVTFGFADSGTSGHIVTLNNPFNTVVLTAGQKYWVEVLTLTDGNHAWNLADATVPTGRIGWSTNDGATWNHTTARMSAFEVSVVPEPGSIIALSIGGAALLARRRRKA